VLSSLKHTTDLLVIATGSRVLSRVPEAHQIIFLSFEEIELEMTIFLV
jgi:hypothetical protein